MIGPSLPPVLKLLFLQKKIEDLDKLEDVKILLSGSPFGFFVLSKALSRRRL